MRIKPVMSDNIYHRLILGLEEVGWVKPNKSCPQNAISRIEKEDGKFEYVSDPNKCIGCGICAGLCPCGILEIEWG